MSRLPAETLSQIVNRDDEYERALRRTLDCNLSLKSDGKYLRREEVHDRISSSLFGDFTFLDE